MIPCACLALRKVLLCKRIYKFVVLRVYFNKSTYFLCLLEHLIEHAVGNTEIVYHEYLE